MIRVLYCKVPNDLFSIPNIWSKYESYQRMTWPLNTTRPIIVQVTTHFLNRIRGVLGFHGPEIILRLIGKL